MTIATFFLIALFTKSVISIEQSTEKTSTVLEGFSTVKRSLTDHLTEVDGENTNNSSDNNNKNWQSDDAEKRQIIIQLTKDKPLKHEYVNIYINTGCPLQALTTDCSRPNIKISQLCLLCLWQARPHCQNYFNVADKGIVKGLISKLMTIGKSIQQYIYKYITLGCPLHALITNCTGSKIKLSSDCTKWLWEARPHSQCNPKGVGGGNIDNSSPSHNQTSGEAEIIFQMTMEQYFVPQYIDRYIKLGCPLHALSIGCSSPTIILSPQCSILLGQSRPHCQGSANYGSHHNSQFNVGGEGLGIVELTKDKPLILEYVSTYIKMGCPVQALTDDCFKPNIKLTQLCLLGLWKARPHCQDYFIAADKHKVNGLISKSKITEKYIQKYINTYISVGCPLQALTADCFTSKIKLSPQCSKWLWQARPHCQGHTDNNSHSNNKTSTFSAGKEAEALFQMIMEQSFAQQYVKNYIKLGCPLQAFTSDCFGQKIILSPECSKLLWQSRPYCQGSSNGYFIEGYGGVINNHWSNSNSQFNGSGEGLGIVQLIKNKPLVLEYINIYKKTGCPVQALTTDCFRPNIKLSQLCLLVFWKARPHCQNYFSAADKQIVNGLISKLTIKGKPIQKYINTYISLGCPLQALTADCSNPNIKLSSQCSEWLWQARPHCQGHTEGVDGKIVVNNGHSNNKTLTFSAGVEAEVLFLITIEQTFVQQYVEIYIKLGCPLQAFTSDCSSPKIILSPQCSKLLWQSRPYCQGSSNGHFTEGVGGVINIQGLGIFELTKDKPLVMEYVNMYIRIGCPVQALTTNCFRPNIKLSQLCLLVFWKARPHCQKYFNAADKQIVNGLISKLTIIGNSIHKYINTYISLGCPLQALTADCSIPKIKLSAQCSKWLWQARPHCQGHAEEVDGKTLNNNSHSNNKTSTFSAGKEAETLFQMIIEQSFAQPYVENYIKLGCPLKAFTSDCSSQTIILSPQCSKLLWQSRPYCQGSSNGYFTEGGGGVINIHESNSNSHFNGGGNGLGIVELTKDKPLVLEYVNIYIRIGCPVQALTTDCFRPNIKLSQLCLLVFWKARPDCQKYFNAADKAIISGLISKLPIIGKSVQKYINTYISVGCPLQALTADCSTPTIKLLPQCSKWLWQARPHCQGHAEGVDSNNKTSTFSAGKEAEVLFQMILEQTFVQQYLESYIKLGCPLKAFTTDCSNQKIILSPQCSKLLWQSRPYCQGSSNGHLPEENGGVIDNHESNNNSQSNGIGEGPGIIELIKDKPLIPEYVNIYIKLGCPLQALTIDCSRPNIKLSQLCLLSLWKARPHCQNYFLVADKGIINGLISQLMIIGKSVQKYINTYISLGCPLQALTADCSTPKIKLSSQCAKWLWQARPHCQGHTDEVDSKTVDNNGHSNNKTSKFSTSGVAEVIFQIILEQYFVHQYVDKYIKLGCPLQGFTTDCSSPKIILSPQCSKLLWQSRPYCQNYFNVADKGIFISKLPTTEKSNMNYVYKYISLGCPLEALTIDCSSSTMKLSPQCSMWLWEARPHCQKYLNVADKGIFKGLISKLTTTGKSIMKNVYKYIALGCPLQALTTDCSIPKIKLSHRCSKWLWEARPYCQKYFNVADKGIMKEIIGKLTKLGKYIQKYAYEYIKLGCPLQVLINDCSSSKIILSSQCSKLLWQARPHCQGYVEVVDGETTDKSSNENSEFNGSGKGLGIVVLTKEESLMQQYVKIYHKLSCPLQALTTDCSRPNINLSHLCLLSLWKARPHCQKYFSLTEKGIIKEEIKKLLKKGEYIQKYVYKYITLGCPLQALTTDCTSPKITLLPLCSILLWQSRPHCQGNVKEIDGEPTNNYSNSNNKTPEFSASGEREVILQLTIEQSYVQQYIDIYIRLSCPLQALTTDCYSPTIILPSLCSEWLSKARPYCQGHAKGVDGANGGAEAIFQLIREKYFIKEYVDKYTALGCPLQAFTIECYNQKISMSPQCSIWLLKARPYCQKGIVVEAIDNDNKNSQGGTMYEKIIGKHFTPKDVNGNCDCQGETVYMKVPLCQVVIVPSK